MNPFVAAAAGHEKASERKRRVGEFAVGQGVARFEDPRLLRGGGRYVDDIVLPRMAFGYVLRSPHAHARIKSIDTAQAARGARRHPGADRRRLEGSGWGDLPVPGGQKRRDGSPMYRSPYPALAQDRVRWVGDYVAFVVAETYAQAADAAELIAVDYEPLPCVTSTADATSPGAPRVWDDCAGQHLLRPPRGRQGGGRRGFRARGSRRRAIAWRSTASPP